MSDAAAADSPADDPATIGFALLMAGVETAVAAAGQEIASLGQVMQQGFSAMPAAPPPATPMPMSRPDPPAALPAGEMRPRNTPPEDSPPQTLPAAESATVATAASVPASRAVHAASATLAPASAPQSGSAVVLVPEPGSPETPTDTVPALPGLPVARDMAGGLPSPASARRFGSALWDQPVSAAPAQDAALKDKASPRAPAAEWSPCMAAEGGPTSTTHAGSLGPLSFAAPEREVQHANPASLAPVGGQQRSLAPAGHEPAQAGAPGASGGPTHGDVFLDGTRVGHWLSETLAREAGGPARGSTGFDSRMGPRWPGALQGR